MHALGLTIMQLESALLLLLLCNATYAFMHHNIRSRKSAQKHRLVTITPSLSISDTINSNNRSIAYGPNSFGDIMGNFETDIQVCGNFSSLERVVITANGNLQRIMSAYYGAPVTVKINKCIKVSADVFDREVELMVDGRSFCTATGKIQVISSDCLEAIESKRIGLGQLFRYLNVLPTFVLLRAGRRNGSLWREYELNCPQLVCRFIEVFTENFLDS